MSRFAVSWKLATAHMRRRPLRLALTALPMIAAACTVVWVVSGYDALVARFDDMADDYLGRYDLVVVPSSPRDTALDGELMALLAADPGVAEATPIFQSPISLAPVRTGESGAPMGERTRGGAPGGSGRNRIRMERPALLGIEAAEPPYPLVEGRWLQAAPGGAGDREAVISQNAAKQLGVQLGQRVRATRAVDGRGQADPEATPVELLIVGIIQQADAQAALSPRGDAPRGAARGPASSALYVLPATAEQVAGQPPVASMACVKLDARTPLSAFRAAWGPRLAAAATPAEIVASQEIETGLASSFSTSSLRSQAYSATAMSLLASLFIIYSTLSMGVGERVRQFAVMRAVALTRGQVAAVIAIESLVLAAIGWIGGLLAGWLLLEVMRVAKPELFQQGAALGWQCVVLSGVCAVGGALLAAIGPMGRATRAAPLDAMKPQRSAATSLKHVRLATMAGAGLIALALILALFVSLESPIVYAIACAAGLTALALGVLLLAPAAVLLAERWLGPLLARLLKLDPRLLSAQLSSNLWRTIGAAAAMTIGLGLYVATQTWGHSMLQPFVPGPWMPGAVIRFPQGVSDADLPAVAAAPSAAPGQLLPIAIEQPKLTDDVTRSDQRANATRADNVVLCGVDVDRALAGETSLFHFDFVDGTLVDALPKLRAGHGCLIADFLQTEAGLKLGDRLRLTPPATPERPIEYEIVGVVAQPGVHWLTKMSGLRRRGGLMAGMVFASYDAVRSDFRATKNDFFWANLKPGATVAQLQRELEPIAARNGNAAPEDAGGMMRMAPGMSDANPRSAVSVTTAADVRSFVNWRADDVIWGMSQLPLVTLAIASIGMLNTVVASVRSRQWDFGVLRAVGLTRGGLFRLVIAEALLVGVVACLLSFAFGVAAGYSGTGLARYVYRHGGHVVPLTIPWLPIVYGFAAALALSLLAALAPAALASRAEPLSLLQAGRSAA